MQNLGDPGFNTLDEPIKTTIVSLKFINYITVWQFKMDGYLIVNFR